MQLSRPEVSSRRCVNCPHHCTHRRGPGKIDACNAPVEYDVESPQAPDGTHSICGDRCPRCIRSRCAFRTRAGSKVVEGSCAWDRASGGTPDTAEGRHEIEKQNCCTHSKQLRANERTKKQNKLITDCTGSSIGLTCQQRRAQLLSPIGSPFYHTLTVTESTSTT